MILAMVASFTACGKKKKAPASPDGGDKEKQEKTQPAKTKAQIEGVLNGAVVAAQGLYESKYIIVLPEAEGEQVMIQKLAAENQDDADTSAKDAAAAIKGVVTSLKDAQKVKDGDKTVEKKLSTSTAEALNAIAAAVEAAVSAEPSDGEPPKKTLDQVKEAVGALVVYDTAMEDTAQEKSDAAFRALVASLKKGKKNTDPKKGDGDPPGTERGQP